MHLHRAMLALLLCSGCGAVTYNSWDDCYTQLTANHTDEQVLHIEHCDIAMKLTHASGAACPDDHKPHNIKPGLVAAHCQSVR